MKWPEIRLSRKTYGRIYVAKPEDVQVVKDTIKEVDGFEYEYMPEDVVAVFGTDDELVYLHKFEIDANALAKACMEKGVWIWIVDGVRDSYA
jgi:hypothetical protein